MRIRELATALLVGMAIAGALPARAEFPEERAAYAVPKQWSYAKAPVDLPLPKTIIYAPLTIEPTAETPEFITKRLDEKRGIVLLVYVAGATDDMEMLSYFNDIKANYAADSSFFSFEARESKQLGDTLTQLRVSDPPILAIIRGDGTVAQLYTGWIGFKVMEQQVADAVRGL